MKVTFNNPLEFGQIASACHAECRQLRDLCGREHSTTAAAKRRLGRRGPHSQQSPFEALLNKRSPSPLLIREHFEIKQGRSSRTLIRTWPNATPTAMSCLRVSPRRGAGESKPARAGRLQAPCHTPSHAPCHTPSLPSVPDPKGSWVAAHEGFSVAAVPGRGAQAWAHSGWVRSRARANASSPFSLTRERLAPPCSRTNASARPLLTHKRLGSLCLRASALARTFRLSSPTRPCPRARASALPSRARASALPSPITHQRPRLAVHAAALAQTRLRPRLARTRFCRRALAYLCPRPARIVCARHRQHSTGNPCRAAGLTPGRTPDMGHARARVIPAVPAAARNGPQQAA